MDGIVQADKSYVALPSEATSTTTQWHEQSEVEALWMLTGSYLLFFGQAGFVLLEAGHVRASLTKQVAAKVLLQVCIVAVSWWAIGYPFAFGEGGPKPNAFVGGKDWFLRNSSSQPDPDQHPDIFPLWMLHMAYCSMAVAVASCALAERGRLVAHVLLALAMSCWIYPVVVHWVWSTEGWLSMRRSAGSLLGANDFIDCAGSCVVHVTAGTVGLTGSWLIGPRQYRLTNSSSGYAASGATGSSLLLSSLGGLFLWFSWYGLAPSNVVLTVSSVMVAARVAVAVTLSAAASCLAVFCMSLAGPELNLRAALDGAIAGLVAISASAAVVDMYGAFVIGLLGGAAYLGALKLLDWMQVDDPIHVAAVHLAPGLWGAVAPGVFATPVLLAAAGYAAPTGSSGIFYGGDGKQLGLQLLGTLVVMLWSLTLSVLLFLGLKHFKLLRVPAAAESLGWYGNNEADADPESSHTPRAARSMSARHQHSRPHNTKSCSSGGAGLGMARDPYAGLQQQQQRYSAEIECAEEYAMGDMHQFLGDADRAVAVPSFATMEWSHRASRASSAAGLAPGVAASHHSNHQPGLVVRPELGSLGQLGPLGQQQQLRVRGSLDAPLSSMGLPPELQPTPYSFSSACSNNGISGTSMVQPGWRGHGQSHGMSAAAGGASYSSAMNAVQASGGPRGHAAGSFVGPRAGSASLSSSPETVRAGSMLVLAPGGSSNSFCTGPAQQWMLQAQRASSASTAAGWQANNAARVSNNGGGRYAQQNNSGGGYNGGINSNNMSSSRASSPADLSSSMDLRRSLMAASAASASYPAATCRSDSTQQQHRTAEQQQQQPRQQHQQTLPSEQQQQSQQKQQQQRYEQEPQGSCTPMSCQPAAAAAAAVGRELVQQQQLLVQPAAAVAEPSEAAERPPLISKLKGEDVQVHALQGVGDGDGSARGSGPETGASALA